jgi:hypothetical protein
MNRTPRTAILALLVLLIIGVLTTVAIIATRDSGQQTMPPPIPPAATSSTSSTAPPSSTPPRSTPAIAPTTATHSPTAPVSGSPPAQAGTHEPVPPGCARSGGAFNPTSAVVSGMGTYSVYAAPRMSDGAFGTPPETNTGKWMLGWDAPGLKPNQSASGAVALDAHTYPDDSALGNALIARLQPGAHISLRGAGGTACYTVVSRTTYNRSDVPASTFSYDGRARLTITVCSAPRLGPGNWLNRTIWVAYPV